MKSYFFSIKWCKFSGSDQEGSGLTQEGSGSDQEGSGFYIGNYILYVLWL